MRAKLWPDANRAELATEMAGLLARVDFAALGARDGSGAWVGSAEVGARDIAEGCSTTPVGYLEGLWVDAGARRQGIGRRLVEAALDWSRQRGYREFASDTQLWNTDSQAFHARIGFIETDRIVCFRFGPTG
jgi:aminoglycoside 6'-N-acetyltransferase I